MTTPSPATTKLTREQRLERRVANQRARIRQLEGLLAERDRVLTSLQTERRLRALQGENERLRRRLGLGLPAPKPKVPNRAYPAEAIWRDANGREMRPCDFADDHLLRTIAWLERRARTDADKADGLAGAMSWPFYLRPVHRHLKAEAWGRGLVDSP